jgi:hypothetical protein
MSWKDEIELPQEFVSHVEKYDYNPVKSWAETHKLNEKKLTGLLLASATGYAYQRVLEDWVTGHD